MLIPAQNLLRWKVTITALHGIATLTTCLRLEHRRRTRRLWWDDRAAVVPAVIQSLNIVILWLRLRGAPMPMQAKVWYSYANSFCFGTIIWWSRISLSLAVVRITPSWSTSRRLAVAMTISFLIFWISLVLGMIVTCSVHTKWQYAKKQILICGPAFHVTIAVTALDIIGDIALIAIPLHQLWRMNHPLSQRRLVRVLFSASVLTLLGSIFLCVVSYAKFIVGPGRLIVWLMICQIGEALSMITSNLLVLICWFRHQVLKETGSSSIDVGDVYVTPHWSFNSNSQSNSNENGYSNEEEGSGAGGGGGVGHEDRENSDGGSGSEMGPSAAASTAPCCRSESVDVGGISPVEPQVDALSLGGIELDVQKVENLRKAKEKEKVLDGADDVGVDVDDTKSSSSSNPNSRPSPSPSPSPSPRCGSQHQADNA